MTVDTNGWELAITIASTIGLIVQVFLMWLTRQDFVALGTLQNGRRTIARFHVLVGLILLFCHAVFIYFGVRLMTTVDPPAYSGEFIVNILLFIGITVGLMCIGLLELRVRHVLAKH